MVWEVERELGELQAVAAMVPATTLMGGDDAPSQPMQLLIALHTLERAAPNAAHVVAPLTALELTEHPEPDKLDVIQLRGLAAPSAQNGSAADGYEAKSAALSRQEDAIDANIAADGWALAHGGGAAGGIGGDGGVGGEGGANGGDGGDAGG